MRAAVIVFPGSNCDRDMAVALETVSGKKPHMVWHGDTAFPDQVDVIAIPGGFSYGDYLRSGAMAARSQIIPALVAAGFHVIIPNQRGYGNSSRPTEVTDYDIEHLTGDLVALLDHYGYEDAIFVGHSNVRKMEFPSSIRYTPEGYQ